MTWGMLLGLSVPGFLTCKWRFRPLLHGVSAVCYKGGLAQSSEVAGALLTITTVCTTIDTTSHIICTQPHGHFGLADSYQDRRDSDPADKGDAGVLGSGGYLGRQLGPSAHKQPPYPKLVSYHHGGWFCEPQTSSSP